MTSEGPERWRLIEALAAFCSPQFPSQTPIAESPLITEYHRLEEPPVTPKPRILVEDADG